MESDMSYIVKTRKGYYEERESYRDPVTGKPRSRFRRYLGKLGVPDINWSATLRSELGVAAAERAMEKADALRGPVVEEPSKLPSGLHVGPVDPVPVEAPLTCPQSDEGQDKTPTNDAPAGSDDASGSSSLE
jgi:hypothetical protein